MINLQKAILNMNRQELISKGRIWQVYPNGETENILFEGCKTSCLKYITNNYGMKAYKTGKIRLCEVIYEVQN